MNRFRTARERAGLSQKEAAISLGVSAPSMSAWENGKTKPRHEHLVAMAELYGTSMDYLIGKNERNETGNIISEDEMKRKIIKQIKGMKKNMLEKVSIFIYGLQMGKDINENL